jgi:hypothetical protein
MIMGGVRTGTVKGIDAILTAEITRKTWLRSTNCIKQQQNSSKYVAPTVSSNNKIVANMCF